MCWGDGSQDCAAKCLANNRCCAEVVNPHLVRDAEAALTAISKAGYAVVPIEPTPDMIAKAWGEISKEKRLSGIAKLGPGPAAREIYRTMISANGAPK
ncbi:hypothetical protein ATM17_21420 [Sphingopyxis macrogoltabida]|uniref:Uncharacterized protein n=1 Tax=Sphingopyxis macrogoltabida TaxID=33050 RepID=A0AAC9AXG6_SPHMC|nr:hypothetical protein ATM17_21420 [Sphingopyxis macrogoltabida]